MNSPSVSSTQWVAVLLDAFACRLRVGDGIARAAVEQAVVAARGAVGEVVFLHQQGAQASQGAVARRSGSRDSSTYDDYVVFFKLLHPYQVVRRWLILKY